MAVSKDKLSWWQLFQGSPYPAYVTCVHPKVFGMTLNKGMQQVSELAVDDILDSRADPDHWQPSTFTLKKGSSVFVLPSDADSAGKQIVSQPWMVRINGMWFKGGTKSRTVKTDSNTENYKKIIKWEEQQLRDMRISVQHFLLEVNYFYRLSDLMGEHAFEGKGQGARNRKIMCQALVKLNIVETVAAAEELISKRNAGTSRAGRLLNRFVAFSTHEAKVTAGGKYGDDSDNSEEGSDEEDGDDEEAEEREEQADTPIPMESVMGTFKVSFLRASQRAPYVPALVAQAAEQRQTKTHKRAALLEEVQQQHTELPSGFFCSLIYIKQTGQLLVLEDWANGKAGADLKEDWAKHSRQETKQLLQQTQQELSDLRRQRELQLAGRRASGLHALADAAAGAAADDDADDAEYVSISDGNAAAAAAGQQEPASPAQQQHSQQVTTPLRQPQRKTPRKSHNPRMAQTQQQQSGQKPQRRRLRPAAAAAGGDDAMDDGQIVSSDGSDIVLEPDLDDTEGQEDDAHQQQQQQQAEEEEEEAQAPPQKKRRAAAAQEHSGSSGTEHEGEGGSSEEEGDADTDADVDHAANNQEGDSEGDADSSSSSEGESSSSETDESDAYSEEPAAAAAGAKGSMVAAGAGKRAAAAAKPPKRGRGRPPNAAAAVTGGNRSTRSAIKTSKGAVLRNGK